MEIKEIKLTKEQLKYIHSNFIDKFVMEYDGGNDCMNNTNITIYSGDDIISLDSYRVFYDLIYTHINFYTNSYTIDVSKDYIGEYGQVIGTIENDTLYLEKKANYQFEIYDYDIMKIKISNDYFNMLICDIMEISNYEDGFSTYSYNKVINDPDNIKVCEFIYSEILKQLGDKFKPHTMVLCFDLETSSIKFNHINEETYEVEIDYFIATKEIKPILK